MSRFIWNPYSLTNVRQTVGSHRVPPDPQAAAGVTNNAATAALTLPSAVSLTMNAGVFQSSGRVLVWAPEFGHFTRTIQYDLLIPGFGPRTVRAHVHIFEDGGGCHRFLAGHYWIRDLENWDTTTPDWVVVQERGNPPTAQEKQDAKSRTAGTSTPEWKSKSSWRR